MKKSWVLTRFSYTMLVVLCILISAGMSGMPVGATAPDRPALPEDGPSPEISGRASTLLGNLSLYFTPNVGQMDPAVLFLCKGRDFTIYYTKDRIVYSLPYEDDGSSGRYTLIQRFAGANPAPVVEGIDPVETTVSYFTGPESDWHTGITPFGAIVYHDLYPGIDLVYRGLNGTIKREFLVRPGADPGAIRMVYDGAERFSIDKDGGLVITAGSGELKESEPVCYQERDGVRIIVPCRFDLRGDGSVAFVTGPYDSSLPLMIDPALVYCGYIGGGSDFESGSSIAVDGSGNAYITGSTDSDQSTFPIKTGPDLTHNGNQDAFVAKVNAAGTALVYCGYIGGSGDDHGSDITVDGSGKAYITGSTYSDQSTFPVKTGPDLTYNGDRDAFVAKVNAAGTALVYCGYIGGSGYESGGGIAVDSKGFAYISGSTTSDQSTFPVKTGPDLIFNGGYDAFVAKVNAAGTALVYCGYIGGSSTDYGNDIAVGSSGNAYILGDTFSDQSTFPIKTGPDLTHNGDRDAFVAKVNAAGTALDYCGYIGGSGYDSGLDIAVDSSGNAYSTGQTYSDQSTFPVTIGPDLTFNGARDAFAAKVNAAGTALDYCGYIGGSGYDSGLNIAVDSSGNAYITGQTDSDQSTFPVKTGPDLTYNGGNDAYVAKVNAASTALDYCGYIGGSSSDYGSGIAVDSSGNAYISGYTGSDQSTFPVKTGPDLTYNGGGDAFVAKIGEPPVVTSITPNNGVLGLAVPITNLAGTGFRSGAKVYLTKAGSASLTATDVSVVSPTQITCTFTIPTGAAIGPWNVLVRNTDGLSGKKTNAFTVKTPVPPAVTGITPASGTRGTTVSITNLAGTGFMTGAKVYLTKTGSTAIAATDVSVVSTTTITCKFAIPAGAATGPWNVRVVNADKQSGTKTNAFTVNA